MTKEKDKHFCEAVSLGCLAVVYHLVSGVVDL